MKKWFLEQGTTIPIVVLGIFDYTSESKPKQNVGINNNETYSIAYAGGFGHGKNSYLYDFDIINNSSFKLKLYGIGFENEKRKVSEKDSIINYKGAFPSDKIAYEIKADFGLVWDGISTEYCSGQYGEYLKYNNPHKTSLYLLCGLPIIVWDKAAIANFIIENNLGIAISNLKDLDTQLKALTQEDYSIIKKNVLLIQDKIMNGGFVEKAVKRSLQILAS